VRLVIIADAGPLVALFHDRDAHHKWAINRYREFREPLLTTEGVLVEALHLLRKVPGGHADLLALWRRGLLNASFSAEIERVSVLNLMRRYADLPISFADASLIRLTEIHAHSEVWTLDRHFRVYRRNGRQTIPLVMSA
jgi:predicted nucleic acid-binding protein